MMDIQYSITLLEDNMGAKALAMNLVQNERTKHIDVRHHFIRECVQNNYVLIKYVSTKNQLADLLTKSVSVIVSKSLRKPMLGTVRFDPHATYDFNLVPVT